MKSYLPSPVQDLEDKAASKDKTSLKREQTEETSGMSKKLKLADDQVIFETHVH